MMVNKWKKVAIRFEQGYSRIVVPFKYRTTIINRYHEMLGHPGNHRTIYTMVPFYYWDDMKTASRRTSKM